MTRLETEYFCAQCRTPFLNASTLDFEGLCPLCRSGVAGFDAAYCYGVYEDPLRELIHLYKYDKIQSLAGPLGSLLAEALPLDEGFDAVAPLPLHWRRRWQRGFNQSELLARAVARRRGVPLVRALRRVRATSTQAGLSNAGRRDNVAGAFACRPNRRREIESKRILLIDDVMTTGYTASACAQALRRAGASRVALLTLARADRRLDTSRASSRIPVEEPVSNA
ncbi:MAG TPA: ComF family protein [Bryobacteraceae bacterium]|nr:ComF family protein [Bryobacteraceae bacterium]